MECAQEWGLIPSQWWACSEDDRAYMFAFTMARRKMQAWEAQEQERKLAPIMRRRGKVR